MCIHQRAPLLVTLQQSLAKGMGLFSRSFAVTHLFVHRFDSDVEPSQREPACAVSIMLISSDVKRGQNLEAEAKAPRPRPGL